MSEETLKVVGVVPTENNLRYYQAFTENEPSLSDDNYFASLLEYYMQTKDD